MFVYLFFVLFVLFFVYFFFISVLLLYMNADVHLHLQDTKKCLDRPLRFGNTSVQRRERLEIKM
jgi:hypothetical protein